MVRCRGVTIIILIILVFFISSFSSLLSQRILFDSDLLSDAFVGMSQGIPIVFVHGDSYQMGYQQGVLLSDDIHMNLRAFDSYAASKVSDESLLSMWNSFKNFVPDEYLLEMQGIADGAHIDFLEIAKAYMIIVWLDLGCISLSCWDETTLDGHMLHARSLDFPLSIRDPVTDEYVHEHQFILIRDPDGRHKTFSPTVAGTPNFGGGISEAKIAIGNQVCQSKDNSFNGTMIQFRIQQALEYANTIDEAISYLVHNRTAGWN